MSVQLHRVTSIGTECPNCKNESVFVDDIKTWYGAYRYTLTKCWIPCGYFIITDKTDAALGRKDGE